MKKQDVPQDEVEFISIDELIGEIGKKDATRISAHLDRKYGYPIEEILFNVRRPTGKLDKRAFVNVFLGEQPPKILGDYIIFFEEGPSYNDASKNNETLYEPI